MSGRAKIYNTRFSTFKILCYIAFVICVIEFFIRGKITNKYIILYIITYVMGLGYYIFILSKKFLKIHKHVLLKGLIWTLALGCYFLLINSLIKLFILPNGDISKIVYTLYMIILIFSLLLFDYASFTKRKKKNKKSRRK